MKERVYALDFLRVFLMLLGVVFHALVVSPDADFAFDQDGHLMKFFVKSAHAFRMPLFFLLSGYFSAALLEKLHSRKFLADRFKRLAVPFVFAFLTVGLISNVLLHGDTNSLVGTGLWNMIEKGFWFYRTDPSQLAPLHLWFLYYLLLFIPIGVAANRFASRTGLRAFAANVFAYKNRPGLLTTLFALFCLVPFAEICSSKVLSIPVTFHSFRFSPRCFAVFFYYFGIGWLLLKMRFDLSVACSGAWRFLMAASVLVVLWIYGEKTAIDFTVIAACVAFATGCFIYGLIGLALRYFNRPSAAVRFLSEASYWIYLVHFPLIYTIKVFVPERAPFWVFVLFVLVVLAICLLTYNYAVRPTILGAALNGRRRPSLSLSQKNFLFSRFKRHSWPKVLQRV